MGDEIQLIVTKLNEPPFNKKLSLVTFDSYVEQELLQCLNDVFAALSDDHKVDLRDEDPEYTARRLMSFLNVVKFQVPDHEREMFQQGLMAGQRNVIYPVLHHVLSRFKQLKKRAYVAHYLANTDMPDEYTHDEVVQDVLQTRRELQEEFKEVHRTVDRLRGNNFNPAELKREINQLEQEKLQLTEKISDMKRRTTGMDGFKELLEATSLLRQEQEEETKLQDRLAEQQHALGAAENRSREASRKLAETRASTKDEVSAQQLLANARKEHQQSRELLERTLPQTLSNRHETINRMQEMFAEPPKTEQQVHDLRSQLRSTEQDVESLTARIQSMQKAAGDDKLAMYRHHSALVTKKLQQKEAAVEEADEQLHELQRDIEDKEAKMNEIAGPKFMGREEFKQYAAQLRNKTNKFKKLKAELNDIRDETVVLTRTVQVLQGRDESLRDFLGKLESERGIAGYEHVQGSLEAISKKTAELDQTKGKTLDEISVIVTNITHTLKERKNRLAPQIKELRAVRLRYQELEAQYLAQKNVYQSTLVGLESQDSQHLQEANQLQEECLREESRYHYLNSLLTIANAQFLRMQEESRFQSGDAQLLRDFKSWKDLYSHKIQQQEQLSKELRKKKKYIEENEGPNIEQRKMFSDLKRLMECKLAVLKEDVGQAQQDDNRVNLEALATMNIGGANVMTLEQ